MLLIQPVSGPPEKQMAAVMNELVDYYGFPTESLEKYLNLSVKQIEDFRHCPEGTVSEGVYSFERMCKLSFLEGIPAESKDIKLEAFLSVLIEVHGLPRETIAKMAGVEPHDIDRILSVRENPSVEIPVEIKYKVAVTVMALRFFLKENESK